MDELSTDIATIRLYLTALAVSLPRTLALFSILPIMTRLGLPRFLQIALAVAFSVPIITPLTIQIQPMQPLSPLFLGGVCLKEAIIGLLIGFVIGIPFWAMEIAGNIVDFVRQAPDAQIQDPRGTTEASITGNLFSIFATLYFISLGGFTIIIDIIYKSYEIWPPLSSWPAINNNAAFKILSILDSLFHASLLLAGPLIIFMLFSLLMLMITSRFITQINVFDMSMSIRNIAFLIAIQVYAIYMLSYFSLQSGQIKTTLETVKGFFSGQ